MAPKHIRITDSDLQTKHAFLQSRIPTNEILSIAYLPLRYHLKIYFYACFPPKQHTTAEEESSAITFTFSCQKQSSSGFLLNGNHIAFYPSLSSPLHTHTHARCSQGNMKGPGRYRDILGPSSISHGQEL